MGKYQGLLDDIKEIQAGGGSLAAEAPPLPPAPPAASTKAVIASVEKRKAGRPKGGKSSNPDFVQVTAYVEDTVHIAVKKALLDLKDTDFSDLVNDLLKKWVKTRT